MSTSSPARGRRHGRAGERVVGDLHVQAGFLREISRSRIAQQEGAAAGQHDAALGDVGAQFRRGLLQRQLDRRDNARERSLQRFEHFSLELILIIFGTPSARLRPEISIFLHHRLRVGAQPISSLMRSAVGLADQHAVVVRRT